VAVEQTLVIVKPDAMRRRLAGEILRRFEQKGLDIVRLKVGTISESLAREHYQHHADKPFFPELLASITAGPVIFAVLEGPNAIRLVRNIVGATNPLEAAPGTIRGDYACALPDNLVHASDSPETAKVEIERFFGRD